MLQVFGAVQVGLLKPTPSPVGFGTSGVASWKDKGPLEVLSVPPEGVGASGAGAEGSLTGCRFVVVCCFGAFLRLDAVVVTLSITSEMPTRQKPSPNILRLVINPD